jgi:hypothetical protein
MVWNILSDVCNQTMLRTAHPALNENSSLTLDIRLSIALNPLESEGAICVSPSWK